MKKIQILNAQQINQKLNRLAYEVYENNFHEKEILIVGIAGNGYLLAQNIITRLNSLSKLKTKAGKIIINKGEPWKEDAIFDFKENDYKNKNVLLVDDVLNSGKTLMYAVKPFLNIPTKKIHTLVLVDRGHTCFPIKADFTGLSLSTTLQEHIEVDFSKKGKEVVYLK
ncbi:MAG: phosphoribosyltransferase [Bacteroidetes bacterium]|nr:phosphoribosyltransferase [Bacteroidota bacterium]